MSNHVPMAKMLMSHGARENPKFQKCDETRALTLITLCNEAETRVNNLSSSLSSSAMLPTSATVAQTKEQLAQWEYRHRLLKRMKQGYDNAREPDPPTNVFLSVSSSNSLFVKFDEPDSCNGAFVTRYKVEWSCYETFAPLAGEQIIEDIRYHYYEIPDLVAGNMYWVRVRAWNMKGYGPACPANPPAAIPSCWREVDCIRPRSSGKLTQLDNLFTNIKNSRPANASEIKDGSLPTSSPLHPRKSNMRRSLKNLFGSAPKFQRTLRRGVYLASVVYNEDRILVTNEDNLPIVEVDETFTSNSIHQDFHWFMKIACTWEDVKSLRQDMDRSANSSAIHFRSKLLQAASTLQSALGIQDLGQVFYRPLRDTSGSIVLTVVNQLPEAKVVNTTHVKWMPISKLLKRVAAATESTTAPEMMLSILPEMISYQRMSVQPLHRGLYLGYLKLKSSVDLIKIMVPKKVPNIVPHVKIRNCANVSKEEWEWLRSLSANETTAPPSQAQSNFQKELIGACNSLLQQLGVSEDEAVSHRLYDLEVVELSEEVSLILLLPPVESVCSIPGHHEEITENPSHLTLPVQVFEMSHMRTYQSDFISRYSRLSSILEMDTYLAQQSQREAFSSEEMSNAKGRVEQLGSFQQKLDEAWKSVRWTMDIITYARDKNVRGGLPLSILFAPPPSPSDSPALERKEVETGSDYGYHSDRSSGEHNMEFVASEGREGDQREGCGEDTIDEPVWMKAVSQPGILRVYAAYHTGLARGTSVKLHVTPRTTAREVVNLVVQQLNRAVQMKRLDGPYYADEQLDDFCLVAVIGARERVLRDDYQPLQLQNPWTKGRLFVRLKRDPFAALEQGHVTSV